MTKTAIVIGFPFSRKGRCLSVYFKPAILFSVQPENIDLKGLNLKDGSALPLDGVLKPLGRRHQLPNTAMDA
jgi:hypothetical protein